ncbi:MAG: NAD(P)-binding protein [Candidatus Eremiobacteraeota bacterium]|nr:NAD(P)-binding protein [Candidatus Eremiobacteraeota bacterium]
MALLGGPADLEEALLKKLGLPRGELQSFHIYRQSIDARKKSGISFVYTLDAVLKDEESFLKTCGDKDIAPSPRGAYSCPEPGETPLEGRPVVIGAGPAGLFAALLLAESGYRPLLLERGPAVPERALNVRRFWERGELDPECNVQFGEGGAGTFSDGKLTTMIRDIRCRKVLQELVFCGAPEEILFSYRPHIGTDLLKKVVVGLRKKIEALGGTVRFRCRAADLVIKDHKLAGVITGSGETLETAVAIVAPGHSARDMFSLLHRRGVELAPKPFSLGVRIEHRQSLIDAAQYGKWAYHPALPPAEYKFAYHHASGRSLYTFCMCPGGFVIAASSEAHGVVTNGMSESSRGGENANSALLVGVTPDDFGGSHPLAGVDFQRRYEQRAYEQGQGGYRAPAQLAGDFLEGRESHALGSVTPTYSPGIRLTSLQECLPPYVIETMREGLAAFNRKLRGFASRDAILTGVETRSSSPVRILRGSSFESSTGGLYPCGEGAGYAGGIVSAAVDGIKAAEAIIMKYSPA